MIHIDLYAYVCDSESVRPTERGTDNNGVMHNF